VKAAVCTKYGPPEVLKIEEVEKPTIEDLEQAVNEINNNMNAPQETECKRKISS
jgi:hypothetical protein